MKAILGFLPKIIGFAGRGIAKYSTNKPGETNIIGYLSLAGMAYFGVDKKDVITVLQGLINTLQ